TNEVWKNDSSKHTFTLNCVGAGSNDLTVQINQSGSATGSQYSLNPPVTTTSVVIPAGSNSITFDFQAINNSVVTGPETVTLTLVDDTNLSAPEYILGPPAEATITILDNNLQSKSTINVATSTPEISEDGIDSGVFIFTRSGASTQNDLYVNY